MPKHVPAPVAVEHAILAMQSSGYAWAHSTTPNHSLAGFLAGEGREHRGRKVSVMAIGNGYALAVFPEDANGYTRALFTVSIHPVVVQENGDWIPATH